MRPANKLYRMFLRGFAAAFLTSLFVSLGVYFVLYILGSLPISRNVLIFLTVLLYALAFAVAKAGMKLKLDFYPFSGSADNEDAGYKSQVPIRKQPFIFKVLAVIWLITGIVSVLWLTPALIIFWFSLHYPNRVIMLCSLIFSIFASIIYSFIKENIFHSIKDRILFFTGGCVGFLTAIGIFYLLVNDKILVTWR